MESLTEEELILEVHRLVGDLNKALAFLPRKQIVAEVYVQEEEMYGDSTNKKSVIVKLLKWLKV